MAEDLPAPSLRIPDIYIPTDAPRKVVVDSQIQRNLAIAREPRLLEVYPSKEELKTHIAMLEATRGSFPSPMVRRYNSDVSSP